MKSLSLKAKLYRILPVSVLLKMFKGKTNSLSSPNNWADNWEKLKIESKEGSKAFEENKKKIFAQSWSTDHYSALLWENYSKEKRSVRIKTSVASLYGTLPASIVHLYEPTDLIQPVDYLGEKKIRKLVRDMIEAGNLDVEAVKGLFFKKREAYRDEKEIRLIVPHLGGQGDVKVTDKAGQRRLEYKIDPLDFIESIYFDTRMPKEEFETFKAEFERLGFDKPIYKSNIHRKPKAIRV